MKKIITLCVLVALVCVKGMGQSISNYAFTYSQTGSLDAMTGASTLTGSGAIVAGYNDDNASGLANIGFTFYFMGTPYTQFSANSNGQMRLGTTAVSSTVTTTASNTPVIVPIGGDNSTGLSGDTDPITYVVTGSAPNRILKVQWKNFNIPFSSTSSTGTNMQAWLYETSGRIDFVYGSMYNNSASAAPRSIFLGSSNTVTTAGYVTMGSTPTFTAATAPVTNSLPSGNITNLYSSSNTTRWVYTFTPSAATAPSGLNFTSVSGSGMTLNWTDNSSNEIGFAVFRSTDNVNFSLITTAAANATSYAATGLNFGTTYYWQVYAVKEALSSTAATGSQATSTGTLSGTKTVGLTGDYASLTAAFTAINASGLSGNLNLTLQASYVSTVEPSFPISTSTAAAAGSYNIVVYPLVTGLSITSSSSTGTINMNGAGKLTFDGRVGATGAAKDLLIQNTGGGYTVQFTNDAVNNTIQYCTVKSANVTTTSGAITFTGTANSLGNSSNKIDNCDITAYNIVTLYYNGIYSSGLSTSIPNTNNTVSNCNISDYFNPVGSSNGIYLAANSSAWTISTNRFFQTTTRTPTTSATNINRAIQIVTASGGGYTITNNIIGYSSASATGTTSYAGNFTNRFIGIDVTASTTTSSIQGNTIANISVVSTSSGSIAAPVAGGIVIQGGSFNIGTTSANTIGSSTGTGSITIVSSTASYAEGIYCTSSGTISIQNNIIGSILNANSSTIGAYIYGIQTAGTGIYTISNNLIGSATTANSLQTVIGGTTATAYLYGIYNTATGTPLNITGNSIYNVTNNSTSTSAVLYGIYNGGALSSGIINLNSNIVRNATLVSGNFFGINEASSSGTSTTVNANSNQIYSITAAGTGTTTLYGIRSTTSTYIHNLNQIYNLSITANAGTATSIIYGIYNLASPTSEAITNNTINTLTVAGASTSTSNVIAGIYTNTTTGVRTVSGNTINTLTFTATGTAIVYGIYSGSSSPNIFKNKIYDLSAQGALSTVYGITLSSSGSAANIYNNYIGDLKAPTGSNGTTDVIRGINIISTSAISAVNVSYNTIYLAATGGASFTTSGIYHTYSATSTTAQLVLRDNIVVNNSTPGTGLTIAFRRSASTDLNNYSTSSNNNDFYAGTPGATRLIYYDGTNADQTLSAFKTRMSTRDQASVTENPNFASTTGSDAAYLHINTAISTQLESGGIVVPGITTDFDGDTRSTSTPDIGADEFVGVSTDITAPTVSIASVSGTCPGNTIIITATITDASGVPTSGSGLPVLYYELSTASTYSSVQGVSTGSNQYTFTFANPGTAGSTINYYIAAQDNASTPNVGAFPSSGAGGYTANPPAAFTPPTTPLTISVTYNLSGTYSVGTTNLSGEAGHFASLTAAVSAYNNACAISGPVVFSLTDAIYGTGGVSETFPITINTSAYASSTNTLTVKPATGVSPTITGSSTTSILKLNGADYVIIDGSNTSGGTTRNLTITNTSATATAAVIWGASASATDGLTNNTIKNTIISGSSSTTTGYGIITGGATINSVALTANSNNTIQNNQVTALQIPVTFYGTSGSTLDLGNSIIGNNIGTSSAAIGLIGIQSVYQNGINISQNDIQNISSSGSTNLKGIAIVETRNAVVNRNFVHKIAYTGTSTTKIFAINTSSGTNFGTSTTPSANTFSNNFVYDISSTCVSTTWNASGINDDGGYGDKFYYNSVSLIAGSVASVASGGYPVAAFSNGNASITTSASALDIRNNIFSITGTAGNSSDVFYANYVQTGTYSASTVDYNDDYVSVTAGTGYIGYVSSTPYATIAAWRTATGKEASSVNVLPPFVSASSDLHLQLAANTPLESGATPISGITTDIDGDARPGPVGSVNGGGSIPDIGADEFDGTLIKCTAPSVGTPTSITASGASITFTCTSCSPGNSYIIEYGVSGFTPGTGATAGTGGIVVAATTSPVTLSGLAANTAYDVYVRQDCSSLSNGYSANSTKATFTTLCTSIATFPWTENFDALTGTGLVPSCWATTGSSGSTFVSANAASNTYNDPYSTPYYMTVYYPSSSASYLWTPGFTLTAGTTYNFSFYWAGDATSGWQGSAYANTTQSSTGATTLGTFLATTTTTTSSYTQVSYSYTPTTSSTYYFGVSAYVPSSFSPFYLGFDNFSVSAVTCAPPTALTASATGTTTASVSWTAPTSTSPSSYDIYYSTSSTAPTSSTAATTTSATTSASLTILTPGLTYYVWVRSACGGTNGNSTWTGPVNFTTPCAPTTVPYTQDFSTATTPAVPSCTSIQDVNADGKTWTTVIAPTSTPSGFTNNVLQYSYSTANAANDWFYTQGLNLTAGTTYTLSYKYANNSTSFVEKMDVAYGTSPVSTAMTNSLASYTSIANATLNTATINFTPATTGTYYIGFHATSLANQFYLYLDDISVLPTYTITSSAGANGTIAPNGSTTVTSGSNQAYTITPATGYHIADVLVDGVSDAGAVSSGTYTFSNVTANHTISATFAINTYTITATTGANGTVAPAGTTTVNYNGSQAYTITPGAGYHISDVLVDGVSNAGAISSGTYTFSNVTANHTISATFAINTYTITATVGANGTVTPSGVTTVNYNGSQAYTITPSAGYAVQNVTVDGVSQGAVTTYTFSNVTANHTISATFIAAYTITASSNAGGTILPSGVTTVNSGGSQTYTITPSTGYSITNVTVDGTSQGVTTTYTFNNVTANHTITATFTINTYNITSSAGANGTISPNGTTAVNYGGNQTYAITPNANYGVQDVTVDGTSIGAVTSYTFTNVTTTHTISATFVLTSCPNPPTANAGSNASVCGNASYTLGGTIGGGATTATWSTSGTGTFSPGTTYSTSGTTTYTPSAADITAGNVVITLTTNNPNPGVCTPATSSFTLTINAAPTVSISGNSGFCTGGSSVLTATASAGSGTITTYQWYNGATQVGTNSNTYTATTAGTYTVVVTNSNTCSTTSNAIAVSVNAAPTVTASTDCSTTLGGNVTLTATATAGSGTISNYQWILNGATNVGTNSPTYTTSTAGSYTVTVTNSNGCSTTSNAVVINAASGPLAAGTYTIAGSGCNNFATLASAFSYINTNGMGGAVTFNVPTGYTETAPGTGLVLGSSTLNATLSATNTLTIVKSGSGTAPVILAGIGTATPASAAPDGILSIRGADYVTINGLTFTDNNTTNPATMEFGIGMFKTSATDGVNNNTIINCTFNMQRVNNAAGTVLADGSAAIGIYNSTAIAATTALTPTAASGANSNNKIYTNTINGGNTGIIVYGYNTTTSPYSYTDQGNDIGGSSSSTGNTILNFGGGGTISAAAGIRTYGQYGLNVSYNTINNNNGAGVNHATTLRGIYLQTATGAGETVNNNTITVSSGATTSQLIAIENVAGGVANSNTVAINNNTIVTNYATATTGTTYGIYNNAASPTTLNINSNTVTVNSAATSGSNYPIYQIGSPITTQTINNNTIGFNFSAVTSAIVRAIYFYGGVSTCTTSVSNNVFNSFTFSNSAATAGSGAVAGIYLGSGIPLNETISGNNFNNLSVKTTGTIYLIYNLYTMPASGTRTLQNNTITTGFTRTGTASSSDFYCYYESGSSTSGTTETFSGNSFNNITANSTGYFYGYYSFDYLSSTSAPVKSIYSNSINNLNITASSGSVYLFYAPGYATGSVIRDNSVTGLNTAAAFSIYGFYGSSGQNIDIYNNNLSGATLTGAATLYGPYYAGSGTGNVYNNTVTNITRSGAGITYGVYTSGTTANVYGNTVTNVTNSAAGSVYGIYVSTGTTVGITKNFVNTLSSLGSVHGVYVLGGTTVNVFQQQVSGSNNYSIYGLSSSGAATVANGITVAGGTTVSLYKNNIYNISNTSSSTTATTSLVNGMSFTAGTTVNAYNNTIGNLTAPAVSYADAVRGISVTSATASTSYNVYFNTIYLNASSTGATFGTSGIYHTANAIATTAKLDLRNNIVINLSAPSGTGITTALRRSAAATLGNYAGTTNNNLYYAGTPDASHTLLYDGTNGYQTIGTFQTAVASRETSSFTGESAFTYSTPGSFFISLTGSDATFLHVVNGITTQAESGGQTITSPSITDDYDGDARPNSGTLPDVGADEFVGTTPAPTITLNSFYVTGTTTPGTSTQCNATGRDVSVNVTTPAGTITSVTITYNTGSGNVTQTMNGTTGGASGTFTYTIPAASPANTAVTWYVTATNSATISATYNGTSYSDAPLTGVTITAAASKPAVCADNTTSVLTATISSGTAPTYTTPSVTNATTDEDLGNVTLTSGATTLFNNTSARNSLTGSIGTATGTAGGYANYTAFGPYSLTAGQTYNFSLSSLDGGTAYSHYMYIFIDYNRDGAFTGSGETVYTSALASGPHTVTGSFVVPSSIGLGSARMRVVVSESALTGSSTTTSYGEFEDYAITLTPSFTYAWSNGITTVGTTNPLTVNPTATTNYTVTATDANGCFITSVPVTVTVNPTPTSPTATNSVQCGTQIPTASVADPNVYTTPTFNWYTAATGGTAVQSSTSATYTSTVSATTTFYVSVVNPATGCESGRTTVTVTVTSPDPVTASATPASVCIGGSTTLTAAQTGTTNTYTYTWTAVPSSGSGIVSGSNTGASLSVTPTATGTYTYTVTAVDGSCTTTSTVSVTVSALPTTPTITASASKVCAGSTVTLTASSGSSSSYCTPTFTSASASGDYISNVTFAGINNTTGDAANDYTYYNSLTANVTAGTAYTLSLASGASFTQYFGVWIDYNQNGTFEQSEFVYSSTAASSLATTSIPIPATAYTGVTRMRVISRFSAVTYDQSCSIPSSFGEAEDYNVNITSGVTNPNAVTYVWSNGSITVGTTQSITVNPTVTTTYTVTATNTGNCSATSAPTTVTIASPLAGIYSVGSGTIPGEAGHYSTLTAAVADYNGLCLGGAVTFALTDATYSTNETFPITINANSGASTTNTLTIKPNTGVNATITGDITTSIFKLNGADYVTIDGSNSGGTDRSLSIVNSNTGTTGIGVWIASTVTDGATNNTVKNVIVKGNSTATTFADIISSGSTAGNAAEVANNNNVYQNDSLTTAQYGIGVVGSSAGETGTVVTGNSIGSTTVALKIGYRGIFVSNETGISVTSNTVTGVTSTNASATNVSGGIIVAGAISGGTITKNKLTDIKNTSTSGYPSYGISLQSTSTSAGLTLSNNFISDVAGYGSSTAARNGFGIAAVSGGGYNIYYNSVSLATNQSVTTGYSADLYIASGVTGLNVVDNIFSNTQTTGTRYAVYNAGTNSVFSTTNYNDYYIGSGAYTGYLSGNQSTLANWQTATAQDANSVSVDPLFTNASTDLHINLGNGALDNLGTPVAGITTDIDAEARNTSTPDIGADEFTATACNGTSGGTVIYAGSNVCTSGSVTLVASGYPVGTSVTYQWEYSSDNFASDVHDLTGQTSVPTATTGILTSTTYFRLRSTCTATSTIWYSVSDTVTVVAPLITSTTPATRCGSGTLALQATGSTGSTLYWYDAATGGNLVGTGSPFTTPAINTTTNYYVSSSTGTVVETGPVSPSAEGGTTGVQTVNWNVNFNVLQAGNFQSVDVYPIASGEAGTIYIYNSGGTLLKTVAFTTTVSGGNIAQTVPINLQMTVGTGYQLWGAASTATYIAPASGITRNITNASYPYTSASLSITGNGLSSAYWMGYYNWQFAGGCESPRTAVTATVNTPPAIAISPASATICSGSSATLTASSTSNPSGYTYTWTPGNLTGATQTVSPAGTTIYTVTATDNTSGTYAGCSTTESATVTVNPTPTAVTVTPDYTTVCAGSIATLTAAGGSITGTATQLSENFANNATAWTKVNNSYGGTAANAAWMQHPDGYAYSSTTFHSNDNSEFFMSNSDAQGYDDVNGNYTQTILTSPAFSTTGLNTLSLSFYHYYRYWSSGDVAAAVEISTDGGTTWTTVKNYTTDAVTVGTATAFSHATLSLNSYVGNSSVKIRFRYETDYGYYWTLDNIVVSGQQNVAGQYTWTPAVGLYTDAAATNPYTGGNFASTLYAKPTATTLYTAASTNSLGCSSTDTVTVIVNPAPMAAFGSPTYEVCYGTSATIALTGTANSTVTYNIDGGTSATATIGAGGTGSIITSSTLGNATTTTTHPFTITSVIVNATGCTTTYSNNPPQTVLTVDATPTIALTSGAVTANQTVCKTNAIINTTYQFGGSATGAVATNLPAGLSQSVTGNVLTISGTPTASGTYTVTTTGGTCTAVSLTGTVTVSPYITWTGATSTDWNVGTNWCSGTVPMATDDVIIPNVTNKPVLSGNTQINGLEIQTGATVDLNSKDFTTGAVSGSGTIIGSVPSTMTVNASGTLNFDATNNTIKNLKVNGTAAVLLGSDLNIKAGTDYGIVTIANGATLNTGGHLTLKSDENGTAAIDANTSNSTYITGNVTVERYIPLSNVSPSRSGRAWRLLTAPVTGATINASWQEGLVSNTTSPVVGTPGYGTLITGTAQGDAATAFSHGYDIWPYIATNGLSSIRRYNPTTNAWESMPSISGKLLESESAYMLFVRGDRSVQNPPTAGATTLRATGTANQVSKSTLVDGVKSFTLTANPFPSAIDWYKVYSRGTNSSLVQDKFLLWDSKLSSYGAYTLIQGDGTGSNYTVTPHTLGGNTSPNTTTLRFIPSGAAFFVYKQAAVSSSANLSVVEDDKNAAGVAPANPFHVVSTPTNVRQLYVNLNLNDGDTSTTLADGFAAKFSPDYEGNEEDNSAAKVYNFNENLNLTYNGKSHIVEARAEVKKSDTLYMRMWFVTKRQYQLQVQGDNFATAPGIRAWLEDNYLGTKQELALAGSVTTINFEVNTDSASSKSDRFLIVFENNTSVLPVTITKVKAAPSNGGVEVSWTVANEVNVKGYTIEKSADGGRTFTDMGSQQPAHNNAQAAVTGYSGYDAQPKMGDNFYRIRIEAKDGTITYSEVVKVTIGASGAGIQITLYPNPVREGKANLSLSNLKAGAYLVSVYTGSGQTVYQKKVYITLANTTQTEQLILGSNIAQGSYQIKVSDNKGNILFNDQLIVGR